MKIKDICTSITDGSHNPPQGISESNFLMLSSKNVFDDCITTDEPRYLSKEDYERENKRTRIQPGDVLLTIVGTVGRAAVVPNDISPFALQRSVAVLHPKTDICSSRFLMYALRSKRTYIENSAKGVAQKGIYLGEVASIDLSVPSMKQQAEIIDTLDRTNAVIRKRQQQLQAFDTLIKARFVEMFGDYHTNNMGFETHHGSELFSFSSGKFLPEEKRLSSGIPVYGGNGVAWFTDTPLISYPTIIIGRVGALCGNIHVVYEPVWITDNAIYIKEQKTNKFTLEFLTEMMTIMNFYQYADFSGQPKITQKPLESLLYLTPPIEMQNTFTAFCKQVNKSKAVVEKALENAKVLYDSLMQKYFG